MSTAADLDWKTSEIASVGHVWAQAPHDTQDESPNNMSLSVVILDSKPLPLIVKTKDPWISSQACDEIQGSFVLTMSGRGFESRITTDNDMLFGDSSCVSCGACAHTCPTDAISDVFQSKSAAVDKKVRTTCSYCGVGCNLGYNQHHSMSK